jgi:alpha-maltose-1-phosphate synthase
MKVALSTIGTFHHFDLARELHHQGVLAGIYSGYPRFKLRREALPDALVHTFPWVHGAYMAFKHKDKFGKAFVRAWERLDRVTFDRHVARHIHQVDVFVGLSGSALFTGAAVQAQGGKHVCDRGSSHIRVQDQLIREEDALWGAASAGVDPWIMAREEAEYAQADCITVPSTFNVRSFVSQGVPAHKMRKLSYGVNLERFHPTQAPVPGQFDLLFAGGMSLRKGVPYLLQAYKALRHPRKSLTFAGSPSPALIALMQKHGLWSSDIRVLGHVDQLQLKDVMSRSHVLVLPSIEEGLALVQAQAMACGCPVVATENTGAEDLFEHGQQGFITPIRSPEVMTRHLQTLADDDALRQHFSEQALLRVKQSGGWRDYGRQAQQIYRGLLA